MRRILLIDDDEDILFSTQRILKRAGFKVTIAQNGQEGIDKFHKDKFDLVLTDMIMPEKEGIEVIREIREVNSEIKIGAMSGGGLISPDFYLDVAKRHNVDISFSKPFDSEHFISQIEALL